jgi:3-oxoacyl-[acyl-carrier-protein] synthase II
MMDAGFVAPTLNLKQVDKRCAGIGHVTKLKEENIRIAQIQNFAFGGVNTALIIQRPE